MKQIIASVFFDILSYTIRNIIICIFMNFELNLIIITARYTNFGMPKLTSFLVFL